ncbi:MAG TPA: NADP-dependent oxidoreductase, partial [Candidatus Binatia bacterium]
MHEAIRVHSFGSLDVIRLEELLKPEPQAGEVLLRVKASSHEKGLALIGRGVMKSIEQELIATAL